MAIKEFYRPDATFSLELIEFREMVKAVRNVESSLRNVGNELTSKTLKSREFK